VCLVSTRSRVQFSLGAFYRDGAVEACGAHNPKVGRSKLLLDIFTICVPNCKNIINSYLNASQRAQRTLASNSRRA
jgi:hypothetical protein